VEKLSVFANFFSGLYTGMLVLLFGLFLRPVGFLITAVSLQTRAGVRHGIGRCLLAEEPNAQLGTLSSTASPPINPSVARTRK